ncbi:hypothetical protein SCLCIDRAFT_613265 [Scleroderma citrinum Foug A]|uniref:DUF6534 domain-containing protein n=1 Tax=Scleroderma citrinum Foug A TaxID=1036808 RepID=A0A0C3AIF3_9AGAM|nr:hypothetical protein SCLCIDRAFT_613265 [Scleroderma citrinum Foug A]
MLLYGVLCVQVFIYFQNYPDDHVLLKYLVAIIWIVESVHTGFLISANNSYLINGFGNLVLLTQISWDLLASFEISFVVMFIVNLFFTWRVWVFCKKVWAVCLLLFLSIARYVMATVSIALGFYYSTWASFKDHAYLPLTITLGVAVFGDASMALILAYYLHEKRTERSTQLITRLLTYVVGTGALTSIVVTMELISILASPNTLLYISFGLVLVRLYANSALLSLNLRQYQRKPRQEDSLPLSNSKTSSSSYC